MKKYLSYGGGVNSTALLLLLKDRGIDFETVFVNHGTDYPETYEYIEYLRKKGFEITEIIPDVEGCHTLYEYCEKWKILPGMFWRWCTWKFKIKPYLDYIKKPCISYIGFGYDELWRLTRKRKVFEGVTEKYPLIEEKLTRSKCIKLIKEHGLKVPPRSGCWLCPLQTDQQLRELFLYYPELYKKIKKLESYRGHTLKLRPIGEVVQEQTKPLTEYIKND